MWSELIRKESQPQRIQKPSQEQEEIRRTWRMGVEQGRQVEAGQYKIST